MIREVRLADADCGMNRIIWHPKETIGLPLIVYLHGAGERGEQWEHVLRGGLPRLLDEGLTIPAVILCPQCPGPLVWDNVVEDTKAEIDRIAQEFQVDIDRITITGSSMGGMGTWSMGLCYPNYFAAMAPVAGGCCFGWRSSNLKYMPIRVLHGDRDDIVLLESESTMVDAVNQNGGHAELIILQGMGHGDGIHYAYAQGHIMEWLMQQRRDDRPLVTETLSEMF